MEDGDRNLQMARAILPELPFDIDAYQSNGAASTLRIYGEENGHVHAMMPWAEAREDMALIIPIRSADRGGYDIACHVEGVYFEGGTLGRVDLAITAVSRRKPYRAVVRAHASQLALLTIIAARRHKAHDEFDVRLVDLSATGFAFLTERKLAAGRHRGAEHAARQRQLLRQGARDQPGAGSLRPPARRLPDPRCHPRADPPARALRRDPAELRRPPDHRPGGLSDSASIAA